MSEPVGTLAYCAVVLQSLSAWAVTCSCGYLVTGLPTQALAQADMDNHWQRCHASDDDDA